MLNDKEQYCTYKMAGLYVKYGGELHSAPLKTQIAFWGYAFQYNYSPQASSKEGTGMNMCERA